ncbi:hypothetical protein QR680_014632 [Steinernema hermaphroditum]|uniref:C-type lectin domain-containing protein n=1 Tax=Steinernema hermaphroditum TaxID=289476 RepID=A0AA39IB32_9BILA|nr:hypothetical protein QR680_014632 [Steinernema hermaphroditum]
MRVVLVLVSLLLPLVLSRHLCDKGCGPNSFLTKSHKCIRYYNQTTDNYDKAVEQCFALNFGSLPSVHNKADNEKLRKLASGSPLLLGARDLFANGTWSWDDLTRWDYTNWAAGEPNNLQNNNCILMDAITGLWAAVDCGTKTHALACISPFPGSKNSSTAQTCSGNYCYCVSDEELSWDLSQDYCQQRGGQLASLHSDDDVKFVGKVSEMEGFWIGGQLHENNKLYWSDGSPTDFTKFAPGLPDAYYGYCVQQSEGQWVNAICSVEIFAVCEMPKGQQVTVRRLIVDATHVDIVHG